MNRCTNRRRIELEILEQVKIEETRKMSKATVVASLLDGWLYKGQKTWFPPVSRHFTGLCYGAWLVSPGSTAQKVLNTFDLGMDRGYSKHFCKIGNFVERIQKSEYFAGSAA